MKVVFSIFLILIANQVIATDNECYDQEKNAYWDDLAIRSMDKIDVVNLVKLRKQLCRQFDAGEISAEDATKIFARERLKVVDGLNRGKF